MTEANHRLITVTRQMGSGGTFVAFKVAKRLGISYFDREILKLAAQRLGRAEDWLAHYDEHSPGLVESFLRAFGCGSPETPGAFSSFAQPDYDRELFATESGILREIAASRDAVIVGRGGCELLRDEPGQLRVLIHAPFEFRARRLFEARRLASLGEAREFVKTSDRNRARFIHETFGSDWLAAENYHLCLDSSRIGINGCVEIVAGQV